MEFKLLIASIILFILARLMKVVKEKDLIKKIIHKKIYNEVYEWIETGWSAVLLAAFLMFFFIQAFKIPSGSMRNTLVEGDHLFVNKFIYGFHVPLSKGKRFWPIRKVQRGDIIVFKCPPTGLSVTEKEDGIDKDFIKRCVAIGGDIVEIKDKIVYVNGEKTKENYTNFADDMIFEKVKIFKENEEYQKTWESGQFASLSSEVLRDNFGPVKIPPKSYFVLGDNRDRSFDSRFWGPLPDNYLKGRALLLYWPLKRLRIIR